MIYLFNELKGENVEIDMNYIVNDNYKNIKDIDSNKKDEEKIKIFGDCFVETNIYKCKILYNDIEYELNENFLDIDEGYELKSPIKFKLKGINNITDISWIFDECNLFSSLPDISNWNTSNVTDIRGMFYR